MNPVQAESRETGNGRISHFVLVHGACHGAWCWYKLSDLLEKAGHIVTAIDLGGAGVNPKDGDTIRSFADMGGVNLTCMMEKYPQKIAVAVFVTAFMPVPRTDPLQLIDEVYQRNRTWGDTGFRYRLEAQQNKPTSFIFGKHFVHEHLYHNSPSEDIRLAECLTRSMPAFQDEVVFSSENYGRVPRAYIVANQDKGIWEELQRKVIADNPPDRVYELEESDHSPFFSCPARLAQILQEIANAFG
eukprot:PITA_13217